MEYKINRNQHNFENYSKQNILHISAPKNEIGNLTARKICKLGQCYQRGGTSSKWAPLSENKIHNMVLEIYERRKTRLHVFCKCVGGLP